MKLEPIKKQPIMKEIVFLLGVLCAAPTFSQVSISTAHNENKWRIGGYAGLNFGSDYFGVGIAPSVGYAVSGTVETGITAGYQYSKQDYLHDEIKQNLFSFGPYVNYYPIRSLFLRAHYEYYLGNQKFDSQTYDFNENALWLGGGYRTPGRVQLFVGAMYNVLYQEGDSLFSSGFRPIIGVSFRI